MADKMNEEPESCSPKPNPFWKENARKLVGESNLTIEGVAKADRRRDQPAGRAVLSRHNLLRPEGLFERRHGLGLPGTHFAVAGKSLLCHVDLLPKAHEININSTRSSKETFEKIVSEKHLKLMSLIIISL